MKGARDVKSVKNHPLGPRQVDLLVYLAQNQTVFAPPKNAYGASITELAASCGFADRWGTLHRANCRAAMRTLVERGLVTRVKQGRAKGWRPSVWRVTRAGFMEAQRLGGTR